VDASAIRSALTAAVSRLSATDEAEWLKANVPEALERAKAGIKHKLQALAEMLDFASFRAMVVEMLKHIDISVALQALQSLALSLRSSIVHGAPAVGADRTAAGSRQGRLSPVGDEEEQQVDELAAQADAQAAADAFVPETDTHW